MSFVRKHSVTIRGHRTSFSLEKPFVDELRAIAQARNLTLATLVAAVDEERPREANLSSALRIFVLEQVRQRTGHTVAELGSDEIPATTSPVEYGA